MLTRLLIVRHQGIEGEELTTSSCAFRFCRFHLLFVLTLSNAWSALRTSFGVVVFSSANFLIIPRNSSNSGIVKEPLLTCFSGS